MPSTNTGSNPDFKSKMPGTTDTASIQDAIRFLLYGGTDAATAIVNSNNTSPGALTNTDGSHGLVGQLNTMKTSLTNSAIQKAYLTAKGQLITATSSGVPALLAAGTDNYVLRANSSTSTGLEWWDASTKYLPLTATTSFPLTGDLRIGKTGTGAGADTAIELSSDPAKLAGIFLQSSSVNRWWLGRTTSSTNQDFEIRAYDTSGTYKDSPISINHSWTNGISGLGSQVWGAVKANTLTRLYDAGTTNFAIGNGSLPSGTMYNCAQGVGASQVVQVNLSDLPIGTTYHFWLDGFSGTSLQIVGGSNVTIQSPNSMTRARTNHSVITIVKRQHRLGGVTDFWSMFGDLKS